MSTSTKEVSKCMLTQRRTKEMAQLFLGVRRSLRMLETRWDWSKFVSVSSPNQKSSVIHTYWDLCIVLFIIQKT